MANMTKATEEVQQAKLELSLRGWTTRRLAAATGLSYGSVRNVLAGRHGNWPAKAAINRALEREIFSKPETKQMPRPLNRMVKPGATVTRAIK
jgi:hypothetical protein